MRSARFGVAIAAVVVAAAAPTVARADAVTDWNGFASTAIVANAGQPPHAAILSFAMVQGAVYDAVNAIDRRHEPYLIEPGANWTDSKQAAAATAAYKVLAGLFPGQLSTLQPLYESYIASLPDIPAGSRAAGVAVGEAAAAAMLAARVGDGRGAPFTFVFGTNPGEWRLAPPQGGIVALDPAPWVGNVRPFIVPDVEMLRLDPPNAVTSTAYAEEFNEVKELGSLTSTTRTADETEAAIFWQDNGVALWNRVMRSLAASRPEASDIADSARMFATADLAAADAAIGCWNNKYYWNYWRPITAIREADTDGNPATDADPTWTPLFDPSVPVTGAKLVTPGFPDYPSGHGCATGAIVHALQDFFGTDRVPFTATSNKCAPAPCAPRSFARFSDALEEVIDARIWAGIHFRTADVRGGVLGKRVAQYLHKHYFQPTG